MDQKRLARLIEFFIIGILRGVTEDLIVVLLATNEEITLEIVGITVLVALPFAGLSELVVDQPEFDQLERVAAWIMTVLSLYL